MWLEMRAFSLLAHVKERVGISYFPYIPPGPNAYKTRHLDEPILEHNISTEVGLRIRFCRLRRDWTQRFLGNKVGVDESTVSKHEKGDGITLDILPRYADAFGLTVHNLIPDGKADNLYPEDARQEKIRQAVTEFQKLNGLSDEKLDEVLKVITQMIHVSLM